MRMLFCAVIALVTLSCDEGHPTSPELDPPTGVVVMFVDDAEGRARARFERRYGDRFDCVLTLADFTEPVPMVEYRCIEVFRP